MRRAWAAIAVTGVLLALGAGTAIASPRVPAQGTPTPPTNSIIPNVTLNNGSLLMSENWTRGTCVSGATYELWLNEDDSGWYVWNYVNNESSQIYLPIGYTWAFGVDCGGAVQYGPDFTLFGYQENSARYAGSWSTLCFTGAWGGCADRTTARGASATFSFYGRGIAWVSDEDSTHGSADVYIDGKLVKVVNTQDRNGKANQMVVFIHGWSHDGSHTIRIVNLATSGHPRVNVDGFVVVQ
jgi:hypothetical protein